LPHFDELGFNYGFEGKASAIKLDEVLRPKQVHGTEIVDANRMSVSGAYESDAIYTSNKEVIGVVTADCLPILICARDGAVVMAIHAGWRGMSQGILLRCIVALKRQTEAKNLLIAIGPCIGPANYEVGPEVIAAFKDGPLDFSEAELAAILIKGKDDRWHLDLAVAGCLTMAKNGVPAENVGVVRSCTYANSTFWHSYRRDGKKAGRNLTWIRRL
jgi:YfiH family protein